MDSHPMSCPTCGHTVSNAAGACAYCGSMISEGEPNAQADEKIAAEDTKPTESTPPLFSEEMPPAADISDETDHVCAEAEIPSEPILSQKTSSDATAAESHGPENEAEDSSDIAAAEGATPVEVASLEQEQALAPDPETARQTPESESDAETASAEAAEPEAGSGSEPAPAGHDSQGDELPAIEQTRFTESTHQIAEEQAQAESGPEEDLLSSKSEVLDPATEEPVESETAVADIMEIAEPQDFKEKAEGSTGSDEQDFSDKALGPAQPGRKDDQQKAEDKEIDGESQTGLMSESLGDTILLEPADEVHTPAKESIEKVNEKTKTVSPKPALAAKADAAAPAAENKRMADVLKIEKAARDMAQAIEKQKEKLAEVENSRDKKSEATKILALKKKKAALAKAQAQKKQKLLLAKAAALKRKKAAEAKARALKKQREAQSGIKTAKNEEAAAAGPRQTEKPTDIARPMEVYSKMQGLVKKYEGQVIGINYDNSAEIKEALLEEANSDYFSVFVKDKKLQYSYPFKSILTVIEGTEGVDIGNSKQPTKFNAVIKVYPLVLF
jgi:hypothetical protein